MPLPAASYDATQTVAANQSILAITPAGGVALNLLVTRVTDGGTLDLARTLAPGAAGGPARTARVWLKSRAEIFKAPTEELEKVKTLLGSLTGFLPAATCTIYLRDPDDAANTVAYKSDDFACAIYRDQGDLTHSGDALSSITLVIESLKDGAVAWTKDASTV